VADAPGQLDRAEPGAMPANPTRRTPMLNSKTGPRPLSPAEYLEMEESSPVKHECIAGQIYAMTGASDTHNFIAGNLYIALRSHLKGSPCRVFMADVKARLDQADSFYYPDVMVSCEKAANAYYREQPCLIVEVLSSSTAKFDAGDKRRDYQALPSLQEYVLVSQECMDVRVWRRGEGGWAATIYTDGAVIPLRSVDWQIPVEQIYADVWA
jgi:Uma2 family endonuclease